MRMNRLILEDSVVNQINFFKLSSVDNSTDEPGYLLNPYRRSILIPNGGNNFIYNNIEYRNTYMDIIFKVNSDEFTIKLNYGCRLLSTTEYVDFSTQEVHTFSDSEIFSILCYLKEPETLLNYVPYVNYTYPLVEDNGSEDLNFFINKINKLILKYGFN